MDTAEEKKKILEEERKRFKRLCEYTFYSGSIVDEAGPPQESGTDEPPANPSGNDVPMDGAPMSDLPQSLPPGNDAGGGAQDMPPPPGGEGMGGDIPPGGDDMPPVPDGDSGPDFDEEDIDIEGEGDDEDVEEVDITELVDKQEDTHDQLSGLKNSFKHFSSYAKQLAKKLDDVMTKTDETQAGIRELEREIVRRNPTDVETMNIRTMKSFPYTEKVDEYWKEKAEENPNYNIVSSNETSPDEKEYILRKSDIDREKANETNMYDSFSPSFFKRSLHDFTGL
jgi:hypothetical protein